MPFDYSRNFDKIDFRKHPELYQMGKGEQGVLLVEPYKSELLPFWRFRTPDVARKSAAALWAAFERYKRANDGVGMDMARKFIQMGYTRARRYANHSSGRKYDARARRLPNSPDPLKARSAAIFKRYWDHCEVDPVYLRWRERQPR